MEYVGLLVVVIVIVLGIVVYIQNKTIDKLEEEIEIKEKEHQVATSVAKSEVLNEEVNSKRDSYLFNLEEYERIRRKNAIDGEIGDD